MLRLALVGLAGAFACVLAARDAAACVPPPPPRASELLPRPGDAYPANGAIFGAGIDSPKLRVRVGGDEARLVPVPDLGWGAAMLSPRPRPGDEVELELERCVHEDPCETTRARYVASAADRAPPPAPKAFRFEVIDHGYHPGATGDCRPESDMTFALHAEAPGVVEAAAGATPVRHRFEIFADGSLGTPVYTEVFSPEEGGASPFLLEVTEADLRCLDPKLVCIRASTIDLAGNASPGLLACGACRFLDDPETDYPDLETLGTAPIFAGGSCEATRSAAAPPRVPGVLPPGRGGCACSTLLASADGSAGAFAALALIALLHRRRGAWTGPRRVRLEDG